MITQVFLWIEQRLDAGSWFRRAVVVFTLILTYRLTNWSTLYAVTAITAKADLIGTAGVITAVAGIPLGLLTLLFNKYVDSRQ